MDIHTSKPRQVQDGFGKNLAKGYDHKDIRLHLPQNLYKGLIPYLHRLVHRYLIFQRLDLHRRHLHLFSPALWFVRLGHHCSHIMACLYQCL